MEDHVPLFDNTPRNQGKDTCIPKFHMREVENKQESNRAGRPIFRDIEWVKIYIPGDSTTVVSKKVTDEHRQRWPEQYAQFKRGQEQAVTGTPLDEWPIMTRSKVAEFKALNIFNVETLANLNDDAISRIGMGTRDLVERAKAFLEAASERAAEGKLAAQLEAKQQQIDAMQAQIDDLAARLADVTGEDVSRETPVIPQVQPLGETPAAVGSKLKLDIEQVNYEPTPERVETKPNKPSVRQKKRKVRKKRAKKAA